jgi:hypothetical protein
MASYQVNAWKHWVVGKNAELEKQRAQGKYQKSFETDILKLRADELNFTLCMFVKEVVPHISIPVPVIRCFVSLVRMRIRAPIDCGSNAEL